MKELKINFSIPVGTYLKLGYRQINSASDYTYVDTQILWSQSPYTLTVPSGIYYEIYTATICGSCPNGISDPTIAYEPMI